MRDEWLVTEKMDRIKSADQPEKRTDTSSWVAASQMTRRPEPTFATKSQGRLPLPTLFYRPEAIHLGDLLRIWVRADATPP